MHKRIVYETDTLRIDARGYGCFRFYWDDDDSMWTMEALVWERAVHSFKLQSWSGFADIHAVAEEAENCHKRGGRMVAQAAVKYGLLPPKDGAYPCNWVNGAVADAGEKPKPSLISRAIEAGLYR